MLALFCLRLAAGLTGCLLLLTPAQVPPRFYRTHFLTPLGLTALSIWLLWDGNAWPLLALLGGAAVLAFAGSVVWWLEGAPGGHVLIGATAAALVAGLLWCETVTPHPEPTAAAWVGGLTSAALLG